MTASTHTFGSKSQSSTVASSAMSSKLNDFLAGLTRIVGRAAGQVQAFSKAAQTGRMMSVLSDMSDQQLGEIGISRSDIPQYAQQLISGE